MNDVLEEIQKAIGRLNVSSSECYLLDIESNQRVYEDCLDHFVISGNRKWWWEDFKKCTFSIDHFKNPVEHLLEYIPKTKDEEVWFMVEADDNLPFYPIYHVRPNLIPIILRECFAFEYYVISKDKEWLICENHHSQLIGSGLFPEEILLKTHPSE